MTCAFGKASDGVGERRSDWDRCASKAYDEARHGGDRSCLCRDANARASNLCAHALGKVLHHPSSLWLAHIEAYQTGALSLKVTGNAVRDEFINLLLRGHRVAFGVAQLRIEHAVDAVPLQALRLVAPGDEPGRRSFVDALHGEVPPTFPTRVLSVVTATHHHRLARRILH